MRYRRLRYSRIPYSRVPYARVPYIRTPFARDRYIMVRYIKDPFRVAAVCRGGVLGVPWGCPGGCPGSGLGQGTPGRPQDTRRTLWGCPGVVLVGALRMSWGRSRLERLSAEKAGLRKELQRHRALSANVINNEEIFWGIPRGSPNCHVLCRTSNWHGSGRERPWQDVKLPRPWQDVKLPRPW